MSILGAVVRVRPQHLDVVVPRTSALPGVDLAINPGDGRLVLVLEDAEVDGTGDRLTRATIDLARASVAEAVGHDADVTWRDEAEASWTELGVDPVGWRLVFSLATATAPAGA